MNYVRTKGVVYLDQIVTELNYDIPAFLRKETLEYLIARKLLIAADIYSNNYKLSDAAIDLLNQLDTEIKQEKELRELEVENLRLQNDKAKYEMTLRRQQEEINSLTAKNLRLQNKKYKRELLILIIGYLIGFITTHWQYVLSNIQKIF